MLNLYQRIREVQKAIGYIQKDRSVSTGGGSYMAVSHDTVTALVRSHMIEHGIVMSVSIHGDPVFEPKDEKSTSKQRLFSGLFEVTFFNADKPDERLSCTLPAHALDSGDKAPGKAISYATKYALLKTFMLETGEDEESRLQLGDYDFGLALVKAQGAETADEARAILKEAKEMAVKLKDRDAARDIGAVGKKLAEKWGAK